MSCGPLRLEGDSIRTHRCTPNRSKPVTSSSVGRSSSSSLELGLLCALLPGETPVRGLPSVLLLAPFWCARWRGRAGNLKRVSSESGPADVARDSGLGRRTVNDTFPTVGVDMVVVCGREQISKDVDPDSQSTRDQTFRNLPVELWLVMVMDVGIKGFKSDVGGRERSRMPTLSMPYPELTECDPQPIMQRYLTPHGTLNNALVSILPFSTVAGESEGRIRRFASH